MIKYMKFQLLMLVNVMNAQVDSQHLKP
jgi:hypothetical protein